MVHDLADDHRGDSWPGICRSKGVRDLRNKMLPLFAVHVASERDSFGLCTELKPMKIAGEVGVEIARENKSLLTKRTETKRN